MKAIGAVHYLQKSMKEIILARSVRRHMLLNNFIAKVTDYRKELLALSTTTYEK
jgi:hypothetical protein